jgi:hypothetical protein
VKFYILLLAKEKNKRSYKNKKRGIRTKFKTKIKDF